MKIVRSPRILLIGYHGMGNFGDDLFLRVVCEQLVKRLGSIHLSVSTDAVQQCPTINGCQLSSAYHTRWRIKRLDWLLLLIAALRSDAVLFCGGSIFAGNHQYGFARLLSWLQFFDRKRQKKRPVIGIGLSFGPFSSSRAKTYTERAIVNFDLLAVRDRTSAAIATKVATCSTTEIPDIALSLQPEFFSFRVSDKTAQAAVKIGLFIGPGFGPNATDTLGALIDAMLGAAVNRNYVTAPTLFVTCIDGRSSDLNVAQTTLRLFEAKGLIVPMSVYNPRNPKDFLESMLKMDCIVSSRLHPSLVGMSAGIPVLQIDSGQPKLLDVFTSAGFRPVGLLKPSVISVDHFDSLFEEFELGPNASTLAAMNVESAVFAHKKVVEVLGALFDSLAEKLLVGPDRGGMPCA